MIWCLGTLRMASVSLCMILRRLKEIIFYGPFQSLSLGIMVPKLMMMVRMMVMVKMMVMMMVIMVLRMVMMMVGMVMSDI